MRELKSILNRWNESQRQKVQERASEEKEDERQKEREREIA